MENSTPKGYNYKTLKVSPETHVRLKKFAQISGKEMIDVLDKVTLFIDSNKISYPQLSRTDTLNPAVEKVSQRLEDAISIIRSIETGKIDNITKSLVRIETDTTRLLSNIEINKNLEFKEQEQPMPETTESNSLSVDSDTFRSLKNEKEIGDLRLKEAADFFQIILSKLAQTSSGYKRSFSEDEVEFMKKYIKKCTAQ